MLPRLPLASALSWLRTDTWKMSRRRMRKQRYSPKSCADGRCLHQERTTSVFGRSLRGVCRTCETSRWTGWPAGSRRGHVLVFADLMASRKLCLRSHRAVVGSGEPPATPPTAPSTFLSAKNSAVLLVWLRHSDGGGHGPCSPDPGAQAALVSASCTRPGGGKCTHRERWSSRADCPVPKGAGQREAQEVKSVLRNGVRVPHGPLASHL